MACAGLCQQQLSEVFNGHDNPGPEIAKVVPADKPQLKLDVNAADCSRAEAAKTSETHPN